MDKIKFITFDNGEADTCHGCVYDGSFCLHPSGDPICVGGIYLEEQEPVQQTITEQGEPKRVKYVALTLFKLEQCYFTESVVFDSQKEAEKWLVGNYQDRSAVSFEIVEMEY